MYPRAANDLSLSRRSTARFLACLSLCLSAERLVADEYSFTPSINFSTEFDDNKRLTPNPHDSVFGGLLDVSGQFGIATETSTLHLSPRARIARYTEYTEKVENAKQKTDLDYESFYVDFGGKRTFDRLVLGMQGNYTRDTTLTSELAGTGTGTGLLTNQVRQSISINPSISYELSERNLVSLGGGYTEVTYEDTDATGLANYTSQTVNLSDTHQVTEKDQLTGSLFVSRSDVPEHTQSKDGPFTTRSSSLADNVGAQLAYSHAFSETLKGDVGAGFIVSDLEFTQSTLFDGAPIGPPATIRETDIGPLFDASITKKFETTTLMGSYGRSVSPSGFGSQSTQDAVRLTATHDLTERLDSGMFFDYVSNEFQGGQNTNLNSSRDYLRVETRLRYSLSPFWSLAAAYIYSRQEFGSTVNAETPESNAGMITLTYSSEKQAMSR
jgi:hypothetical protein